MRQKIAFVMSASRAIVNKGSIINFKLNLYNY